VNWTDWWAGGWTRATRQGARQGVVAASLRAPFSISLSMKSKVPSSHEVLLELLGRGGVRSGVQTEVGRRLLVPCARALEEVVVGARLLLLLPLLVQRLLLLAPRALAGLERGALVLVAALALVGEVRVALVLGLADALQDLRVGAWGVGVG
jgi:hypothetical protein